MKQTRFETADIADAALWLASDESSFVTRQVIHVSGGQTLRRNPSITEIRDAVTREHIFQEETSR